MKQIFDEIGAPGRRLLYRRCRIYGERPSFWDDNDSRSLEERDEQFVRDFLAFFGADVKQESITCAKMKLYIDRTFIVEVVAQLFTVVLDIEPKRSVTSVFENVAGQCLEFIEKGRGANIHKKVLAAFKPGAPRYAEVTIKRKTPNT